MSACAPCAPWPAVVHLRGQPPREVEPGVEYEFGIWILLGQGRDDLQVALDLARHILVAALAAIAAPRYPRKSRRLGGQRSERQTQAIVSQGCCLSLGVPAGL